MGHTVGPWRGGWGEYAQRPADPEPAPVHYANVYPTREAAMRELTFWAGVYQWKEEKQCT